MCNSHAGDIHFDVCNLIFVVFLPNCLLVFSQGNAIFAPENQNELFLFLPLKYVSFSHPVSTEVANTAGEAGVPALADRHILNGAEELWGQAGGRAWHRSYRYYNTLARVEWWH